MSRNPSGWGGFMEGLAGGVQGGMKAYVTNTLRKLDEQREKARKQDAYDFNIFSNKNNPAKMRFNHYNSYHQRNKDFGGKLGTHEMSLEDFQNNYLSKYWDRARKINKDKSLNPANRIEALRELESEAIADPNVSQQEARSMMGGFFETNKAQSDAAQIQRDRQAHGIVPTQPIQPTQPIPKQRQDYSDQIPGQPLMKIEEPEMQAGKKSGLMKPAPAQPETYLTKQLIREYGEEGAAEIMRRLNANPNMSPDAAKKGISKLPQAGRPQRRRSVSVGDGMVQDRLWNPNTGKHDLNVGEPYSRFRPEKQEKRGMTKPQAYQLCLQQHPMAPEKCTEDVIRRLMAPVSTVRQENIVKTKERKEELARDEKEAKLWAKELPKRKAEAAAAHKQAYLDKQLISQNKNSPVTDAEYKREKGKYTRRVMLSLRANPAWVKGNRDERRALQKKETERMIVAGRSYNKPYNPGTFKFKDKKQAGKNVGNGTGYKKTATSAKVRQVITQMGNDEARIHDKLIELGYDSYATRDGLVKSL